MTTQRYPLWKEGVERVLEKIKEEPEYVIRFEWLEQIFGCKKGSYDFNIAMMNFSGALRSSGIFLILLKDIGYKVANDKEKAAEVPDRYHRRAFKNLLTEQKCLQSVNPGALTVEERDGWDRRLTKSAMVIAHDSRLTLNSIEPQMIATMDTPKLLDLPSKKAVNE